MKKIIFFLLISISAGSYCMQRASTTPNYTISTYNPKTDFKRVYELFVADRQTLYPSPILPCDVETVIQYKFFPDTALVCKHDKCIIGFVNYSCIPVETYLCGLCTTHPLNSIDYIAIDPKFRNQGIAKLLVAQVLKIMAQHNDSSFHVDTFTRTDNKFACKLFEHFQFRRPSDMPASQILYTLVLKPKDQEKAQ